MTARERKKKLSPQGGGGGGASCASARAGSFRGKNDSSTQLKIGEGCKDVHYQKTESHPNCINSFPTPTSQWGLPQVEGVDSG